MPFQIQGAGFGLRIPHIQELLATRPPVDWLEVHICNFLGSGLNRALLDAVAEHYALSFHSVSLNLGGSQELSDDYLTRLSITVKELNPGLISCHACFSAHEEQYYHDLLPVPFNEQTLINMTDRVDHIQNRLGRQILIENVSRYLNYPNMEMDEQTFLVELCRRSGSRLLLDLSNIYINAFNLGCDLRALLINFPIELIGELHLGGFSTQDGLFIDSHCSAIDDGTWQLAKDYLYNQASNPQTKTIPPLLVEWDQNLPSLSTLLEEQKKAQQLIHGAEQQQRLLTSPKPKLPDLANA
ncbi:DUF692 domain-containing protein [Agaribacterium sp. ZY112]|uniref:DUF692 domain-containing protein n=1 Tax=Agaribacterium sp. ZY112 TaxID=3233574 RepID=UPI0035263046